MNPKDVERVCHHYRNSDNSLRLTKRRSVTRQATATGNPVLMHGEVGLEGHNKNRCPTVP